MESIKDIRLSDISLKAKSKKDIYLMLTVQGVSPFDQKWMPTKITKEELLMELYCSYTQRMSSELKFHK